MQARRPDAPPPSSRRPPQRRLRPRRAQKRVRRPWGKIGEACAQLSVGSIAIAVAACALAGLIPHYQAQQERLESVRLEVSRTQGRVARLRARLHHNFDPRQAGTVMQEQTARVDPQLWPIVFLETDAPERDRGDRP